MVTMEQRRARMVSEQLARRGIADESVLDAFGRVPREEFVDPMFERYAYDDGPLSIGYGQTISQPYVVAMTVEALALQGHERVLEIGTGSGYAAAILGLLAREVDTIERIPELAAIAARAARAAGLRERPRALRRRHARLACRTRRTRRSASPPARRARRSRCSISSRSAAGS